MVLAHNINHGQRTQDIKISEDVTFDSMLLSPSTLQGLKDSGFYKPSPIQFNGIPFGKCGFGRIKHKYKDDVKGLFKYCNVMNEFNKFNFAILTKTYPIGRKHLNLSYLNYYVKPKYNNVYSKRTIQYLIPKIINDLPGEIQNCDLGFSRLRSLSPIRSGCAERLFGKDKRLHCIELEDLLLEAKSGTGKTAVFSIIVLEKLDLNKGLQAVVLAPTREIAAQICDVIKQIGSAYEGLQVEVVMGGMPLNDDICKFKKQVHMVVGSPGRLKHLIQDGHMNTKAVRILVLDEADKLMEPSFQVDIQYIFHALPKEKQVIMSSATYPESSKSFIDQFIQGAQTICPDSNCVLLGVQHKVTLVKYNSNVVRQTQNRFKELLRILTKKEFKQCLIFCNYQARVTELYKMLTHGKWPAEQLYGQQDQTDRLDALKTLQEYKCRILVSTDLAARGIDASNVDLVINFEPPFEWQTYLHRIGRSGRYGSYGTAITILSDGNEIQKFKEVISTIKAYLPLTYLWTDEEFSVDNSNKISSNQTTDDLQHTSTVITDNLKKDNYKKLWSIFTSKDVEASEQMLNFQNLCNSFQESETESFSQLLNSFNKSELDNDSTCVYEHMDMKFLQPNKDSVTSIGTSKNPHMYKDKVDFDVGKNTRKHQEQKSGLSMECSELCNLVDDLEKHRKQKYSRSESLNSSTKSDSEASLLADQQLYSKNKVETEVNQTVKSNNNDSHEHLNNYNASQDELLEQSYEDTEAPLLSAELPTSFGSSKYNKYNEIQDELEDQSYENTETALLNAGLPTSFGSSKYKNFNLKKNMSRKNVNNQIKENIKQRVQIDSYCDNNSCYYDDSDEVNSQYENTRPSTKNNKTTFRKNYFASGSSKDCKSKTTTGCKKIGRSKNDKDTNIRWQESDLESNSSNSSCLSKDYINWYSQLKARMRQIEYIYYVNELSKM